MKTFVKYAVEPRIYFFARNTASAERVVAECLAVNPKADFEIVKADLSSVVETDRACQVVKAKEKGVNLVVLSMGEVRMDRARKFVYFGCFDSLFPSFFSYFSLLLAIFSPC